MHMESTAGHAAPFRPAHATDAPGAASQAGDCGDNTTSLTAQLSALIAENRELRAEIERLRGERNRVNEMQARVMELVGSKSADRLLHDLRNVLNERELYRALADATM